MKSSIKNKKILLTRPEGQNADWASYLTSLGAQPVTFPLIEIKPVLESEEIDKVFQHIADYQWIIFTSLNAARCFLDLMLIKGVRKLSCSIAAVGEKTALYLEKNKIEVDFIPKKFTSLYVAETIPDIKGAKILIPRTDIADDALFVVLTGRGALVDELVVYNTRRRSGVSAQLQGLIDDGMDVITFASPSAVEAFRQMQVDHKNTVIACIGPVTAQKSNDSGLHAGIVAEQFTAEGLTDSIMEYFEKQP